MINQTTTICALWDWTEAQLLELVGPGPYVIYGGGPNPPPDWASVIDGVPVLHDPVLPFNCTRVAQQSKED